MLFNFCSVFALLLLSSSSKTSFCSLIPSRAHEVSSILTPFADVIYHPAILPSSSSYALGISEHQVVKNSTERGLTLNYCETGNDCQGNRTCKKWKTIAEDGAVCGTDVLCVCFPPNEVSCTSSDVCEEGEMCAGTMRTATPICISTTADAPYEPHPWNPWAVEVSDMPGESPDSDPPTEPSKGLTFDDCRSDDDCQGTRTCIYVGIFGDFDGCAGRRPCRCEPVGFYPCFDPQDCERGEQCAEVAILSFAACVSETMNPIGVRQIPFTGVSKGLNLDTCRSTDDCRGNRLCYDWQFTGTGNGSAECSDRRPCMCMASRQLSCKHSDACVDGEVCSSLTIFLVPVCISEVMTDTFLGIQEVTSEGENSDPFSPGEISEDTDDAQPSPVVSNGPDIEDNDGEPLQVSPEPDAGTCIDARVLQHLNSEDLVFERDTLSRVLCDGKENCATEGHMIVMHGKPMMMRTYCEISGCVERVMYVNSPRYKKGIRLESNSEELLYTALSARYGTRTEEGVLSIAVRFGL